MATREPMGPEAEGRLLDALRGVVDGVDSGLDPTTSVAKAARAHAVPAGHVHLLVNAYNVGATTAQRKAGAGPAEKAADFPVAELAGALDLLYPAEKAAAAPAIAADYALPPSWYEAPRPSSRMAKAAEAPPGARPLAPPEAPSLKKAQLAIDARARRVAPFAEAAVAAELGLLGAMDKVAFAVSSGDVNLADLRVNADTLHGPAGAAFLDAVGRARPGLAKAAASPANRHREAVGPAYAALAEGVKFARDLVVARGLADDLRKAAAAADAADLAPFRAPGPPPTLLESLGDRHAALEAEVRAKAAGDFSLGGMAQGAISKGLGGGDRDAMVDARLADIATPEHEQNLRSIQARAMLSRLLNGDEVLAGHDPYEVAHHYNDLARFAPNVASQPMTAGPAVRKAVTQGHLDTFDANELAGIEGKVRPGQPVAVHAPKAKKPDAPKPKPEAK